VANTLRIAEQTAPALDLGARRYPEFDPAAGDPNRLLRDLVWRGAKERYRRITPPIQARLEHELNVIEQLGFASYFLLVWDVVRFARSRGIRCAGRGSAADSAVAYCLYITEVDAIARGLLFERFLSLERAENPDIDVDFDARRRDEVAAYVYERWGREHVAAVATYNTFQARSAIRDLGKAMGFAESTLDWLAKRIPWFTPADGVIPLIERLPELRTAEIPWGKLEGLLKAAAAVAHLPRFLGTHLGGLVISGRPLLEVTPLQISAKGVAITQFDKEYVEDLGLIKLDLLSLRTLAAVEDAAIVLRREGIDPDAIVAEDPETYAMLGRGETIGVFQLESPAQRQLQARLQANRYEDLVASVALIRPGPIQGNMVDPFLARRKGEEPIVYLHPRLEPILKKTYGVVLFQEQAIEIATVIAGFSPGEADQLRRVMTKGRNPEDMAALGRLFREKAVQNGVEEAVADTIFTYIRGYASYGFCEAHAAAFANTAYKTAYLVRHHPAEYFAALMSAQPMGYYPINVLAGDARRRGVGLLPLDLNRSDVAFSVEEWTQEAWERLWADEPFPPPYPESGKAIRIGLQQVKGLGTAAAEAIVAARGNGYHSLLDLCQRTAGQVSRDGLEALISAGALDSLHPNRRALLWALPEVMAAARAEEGAQGSLLGGALPTAIPDWSWTEKYAKEYEYLGLMVRGHVMAFHRANLEREGYLTAAAAKALPAGTLVKVAGVPICPHRPPTRSGKTVVFLSLEDETGLVDLTVFEDVYQRFGHLIFTHPRPPLAALGRIERRDGHTSVTVLKLRELR
jgi:error-prone DNA polymerase